VDLGLAAHDDSEFLTGHGSLGILLESFQVDNRGILVDVDFRLSFGLCFRNIEEKERFLSW
jgi:hypothetical protein